MNSEDYKNSIQSSIRLIYVRSRSQTYLLTAKHTNRQTDRLACRQTDKQTDRQTDRQTDTSISACHERISLWCTSGIEPIKALAFEFSLICVFHLELTNSVNPVLPCGSLQRAPKWMSLLIPAAMRITLVQARRLDPCMYLGQHQGVPPADIVLGV